MDICGTSTLLSARSRSSPSWTLPQTIPSFVPFVFRFPCQNNDDEKDEWEKKKGDLETPANGDTKVGGDDDALHDEGDGEKTNREEVAPDGEGIVGFETVVDEEELGEDQSAPEEIKQETISQTDQKTEAEDDRKGQQSTADPDQADGVDLPVVLARHEEGVDDFEGGPSVGRQEDQHHPHDRPHPVGVIDCDYL